jgi:hypothetical protein
MRGAVQLVTAVLGTCVVFVLLTFQLLDFEGNKNFLVSDVNPSQGTSKINKIVSPTFGDDEVFFRLANSANNS